MLRGWMYAHRFLTSPGINIDVSPFLRLFDFWGLVTPNHLISNVCNSLLFLTLSNSQPSCLDTPPSVGMPYYKLDQVSRTLSVKTRFC